MMMMMEYVPPPFPPTHKYPPKHPRADTDTPTKTHTPRTETE